MNHPSMWALVFALAAAPWASGAAVAQEPPHPAAGSPPSPTGPAPVSDDGRRTVARLPVNLVRATVGVFNPANLTPVIIGSALTGVAAVYDGPIAEAVNDPDSTLGPRLETVGAPRWSGVVVGALFVGGRFARGTRFRAASYDWLEAYLVNTGYTEVLKDLVGRTRPNRQDDTSFPSGHASNAFALAAVADGHFGWKVAAPAYAAAGLIAVSRLQQNAHYLSDVLGGATLGYIVGRTVVRVNNRPRSSGNTRVNVSPVVGRNTRGVVLRVEWR
jgi:membrane-associated phospholipid phosphatase